MGPTGPLQKMEFDRHLLGRAISCSAVVLNHISLLYCRERARLKKSSPAMVVFLLGNSDVCVRHNFMKSGNFSNRLGALSFCLNMYFLFFINQRYINQRVSCC